MKTLVLIFGYLLFNLNSFSQSLAGIWKGTYTAYLPLTKTVNEYYKNTLKIEFLLNSDSSYLIYSYSQIPYGNGSGAENKCEIVKLSTTDDNVVLLETKVIDSKDKLVCLKKMELKLIKHKKTLTLEGKWTSSSPDCDDRGSIYLYKKL